MQGTAHQIIRTVNTAVEGGYAMNLQQRSNNSEQQGVSLRVAIVGAGKESRFFLDPSSQQNASCLHFSVQGVCDIDPRAEGILRAKKSGIKTTSDFRELLKINDLDGIIVLTGNRQVLLDIIKLKPDGIWVIENDMVRQLRHLARLEHRLQPKEQELALEKMVADFLIQQAHERIVLLAPDFTIMEANDAYLKAVGKRREEVIGEHCYQITHGFTSPCAEWLPEMGCPMIETLRTGQSAHVIHEHEVEGGKMMFCDLEAFPVKNRRGDVVRVIEIWRDVTEELSSRWETKLNDLKTDLGRLVQEDRMLSLGKLSASCVHEINNPIQGLLTFCDLMRSILAEGTPTPSGLNEFREYLDLMSKELERCGNLVSGLLSFARESSMEPREIELKEVLDSVIALTKHKMELQEIRMQSQFPEAPLVIRGDVNQLQQCFLNLIFNAMEAMPDGGDLFLTAKLSRDRRSAEVIVQDTGLGIPEENLDHIFDPFFTTKGEGKGTGLGLSIAYGIIKSHDGHVEVKTEKERGSKFIVSFPVCREQPYPTG
jgi:PAS domain S-box-containing protein